jgi:hypothetical protein
LKYFFAEAEDLVTGSIQIRERRLLRNTKSMIPLDTIRRLPTGTTELPTLEKLEPH